MNRKKLTYELKTYPVAVVIAKTLNKIPSKLLRIVIRWIDLIAGTHISDRKLLRATLGYSNLGLLGCQLAAKQEYFLSGTKWDKKLPISKRSVQFAELILQGGYEFLGKKVLFADNIDWHTDFSSGYRWDPSIYYSDIVYGLVHGTDIKVPREMSRLQFLSPLATAYLLTKKQKYLQQVDSIVSSWISNNPPKFGPAWDCSMDVAIRAINLCLIYSLLRMCDCKRSKLFLDIFRSLYSHAEHLIQNLEYSSELTNNHYLSNIVGLVYIGVYFPELRRSDEWLAYGLQELVSEMKCQINPEGTDFEASTSYHRLVTELFLSATSLAKRISPERRNRLRLYNSKKLKTLVGPRLKPISEQEFDLNSSSIFPDWYINRLEKMLEFVLYVTKPNGKVPQIGDNDSGRVHKFTVFGDWNLQTKSFDEDFLDHRHLLAVGGELFNRDDFREAGVVYCKEAFWYGMPGEFSNLLLEAGVANKRSLSTLRSLESKAFPGFGLYIMRRGNYYMAIRCGNIGQNEKGGHAHNDQLSFELQINGEDVFVDPGTYAYTSFPEWRNYFRSTANHNTIRVDKEEQNRYFDWTLFGMFNDTKAKCLEWECNEKFDYFSGEHYGYERLTGSLVHRRQIMFNKPQVMWEITDTLLGAGSHALQWNFVLASGVDAVLRSEQALIIQGNNFKLSLELDFQPQIRIEDGWYSPKYGVKLPTKVIRIRESVADNCSFKFKIQTVGSDGNKLLC